MPKYQKRHAAEMLFRLLALTSRLRLLTHPDYMKSDYQTHPYSCGSVSIFKKMIMLIFLFTYFLLEIFLPFHSCSLCLASPTRKGVPSEPIMLRQW